MSTNTNRVNNPMKVITGPDTRWSYANVWEPTRPAAGAIPFQRRLPRRICRKAPAGRSASK